MKLLLLHASPKKKGGASRFFAGLFRLFLPGVHKKTVSLSSRQDFGRVLELFPDMDGICLFVPLYVDGLPSHVVEFLVEAEEYCRNHSCRFRLYAVSNNGFVEGKQNRPALHMLRAWCEKAGVTWGGGLGIGGGVMLWVLGMIFPVLTGIILAQMVLSVYEIGDIPWELWESLIVQIFTWLFLNSGVLLCMARLSLAVNRGRVLADQFTRVMIPSVLFVPVADLFMVLASLVQGRFLFTLLKRDNWYSRGDGTDR